MKPRFPNRGFFIFPTSKAYTMLVSEITSSLEQLAPPSLQESYDNAGLLVGNPAALINKALICLDVTEAVIDEAHDKGCGLIIAHHPLIFSGLKTLTGKNYVERSVIKAIKYDIAIYALHTNLDNISQGVNRIIGEKLGIGGMRILSPKRGLLKKLVTFIPAEHTESVLEAIFKAGAGSIGNYDQCSFRINGRGTFRAGQTADPFLGEPGARHTENEDRVEVILPEYQVASVLKALKEEHPYEEVAYDLYALENDLPQVGSGMIGQLDSPLYSMDFLKLIKDTFGGVVRHTRLVKDQVQKIAWCGGSGSFLLHAAKKAHADVFLTSDFKYHQFFDAENEVIIADIGHYENEQFTIPLIARYLQEKFPNFAVLLTAIETNPVNYF